MCVSCAAAARAGRHRSCQTSYMTDRGEQGDVDIIEAGGSGSRKNAMSYAGAAAKNVTHHKQEQQRKE